MKSYCSIVFIMGFLMSGCEFNKHEISPTGISEAEADFISTPELENCAEDEACADHAAALFWVAAMKFSDLSAKNFNYETGLEQAPYDVAISPDIEIDVLLDEILTSKPPIQSNDLDVPEYDVASSEFKDAYSKMKRSHDLGNAYASNELGLIHFEDDALKDLKLAEDYFLEAVQRGDAMGYYNLARLHILPSHRDDLKVIQNLERAADSSDDLVYFYYKAKIALNETYTPTNKERAYLNRKSNTYLEQDWDKMFAPYLPAKE